MENFQLTVQGVGGLNLLVTALDHTINEGIKLDLEADERGFSIRTESRRAVRGNIRSFAELLQSVWDVWEFAHLSEKCEHDKCPVNSMSFTEITEHVRTLKDSAQALIDHANKMDEAAGDQIDPEPNFHASVADQLARIMVMVNPN